MGDRNDLRPRPEQLLEFIEHKLALIVDGRDPQLGFLFITKQLPRDDIRVMLHRGDQHFVARADVSASVSLRD